MTATRRRVAVASVALAVVVPSAACDDGRASAPVVASPDPAASATPATTSVPAAAPTVAPSDPVPRGRGRSVDTGCVDVDGTLHAAASAWYPATGGGGLSLNGDRVDVPATDPFVRAATDAVAAVAPRIALDEAFEFVGASGCPTHRYARFTSGDEHLVVSAWRLDASADSYEVPNEGGFAGPDASGVLAADGEHIAVVLAVAPDGTTARVTSYGPHAEDLVAGWPTTAAGDPADAPGPTSLHARDLRDVATSVLRAVLDAR